MHIALPSEGYYVPKWAYAARTEDDIRIGAGLEENTEICDIGAYWAELRETLRRLEAIGWRQLLLRFLPR